MNLCTVQKVPFMKLKSFSHTSTALLLLAFLFAFALRTHAVQLPNPTITASARPFAAAYVAANVFDTGNSAILFEDCRTDRIEFPEHVSAPLQ